MEAVVFFEFAADAPGLRAALLDRVAPLALSGEGRLSFVGAERGEQGAPAMEVIAVGFKRAETASSTMLRWRNDPALPGAMQMRLLRIEPIWSIEPLVMMFP